MSTMFSKKIFYAMTGLAALVGVSAVQPAQATPATTVAGVMSSVESPVEMVTHRNRGRHLGWNKVKRNKGYGNRNRVRPYAVYNRGYRRYDRNYQGGYDNRSGHYGYQRRGYQGYGNQGSGLGVNSYSYER